jgi:hypothetical protein
MLPSQWSLVLLYWEGPQQPSFIDSWLLPGEQPVDAYSELPLHPKQNIGVGQC